MKRLRRNKRGQFVIIAALLISVLTLSLAVSVNEINLHRQVLRYKPVQELVLGLTTDLERTLAHTLNITTEQYYFSNRSASAAFGAKTLGNQSISKWTRSVTTAYSSLTLNITTSVAPDSFNFQSWQTSMGMSSVDVDFSIDVNAYGFKGWVGHSAKYVTLKILSETVNMTSLERTLEFQVQQSSLGQTEGIMPVQNLDNRSIFVGTVVTGSFPLEAEVTSEPVYLGGGNYTVSFKPMITGHIMGIHLTVVTPDDGIYVSAYRNDDIVVALQSQEESSQTPTQNLGTMQLGNSVYDLSDPSARGVPTNASTYLLAYAPENASYIFSRWETSGYASIANLNSNITSVTIYGNCTITAIYQAHFPPEPTYATITLTSQEWDNSSSNFGTITVNSTPYSLSHTIEDIVTGNYAVEYTPDENHYFLWWTMTGNIRPWDPYDNKTTLTITGNGTLTAIYAAKPPIAIKDPALNSRQDNAASDNLGTIQFGDSNYTLPDFAITANGTYLLAYTPSNASFAFLNWTSSGEVMVSDPSSNVTAVTVQGVGTITAFYTRVTTPEPQNESILLDSQEEDGSSAHLGAISINSTSYSLSRQVNKTIGDYAITYTPPAEHVFLRWEVSGNILVRNSTSNVTTLRIFGNGSLTTIYTYKPTGITLRTITLSSKQNSSATQNMGQTQLATSVNTLPYSASVTDGTYYLEYLPTTGYTFLNWTTIGNTAVQNASSQMTSLTVSGSGTVTAFYIQGPTQTPSLFEMTLASREENSTEPLNLGIVVFNSTSHSLPTNLTGLTAGTYTIRYEPNDTSYHFVTWKYSGGIIPWDTNENSTKVTILGNGTLTAVYALQPPMTQWYDVTLRSREETLASTNLGTIQITYLVYSLPHTLPATNASYYLEYRPMQGYVFVNWTSTANINLVNPFSQVTSAIVNGDGTITAFYRGYDVELDSRQSENQSLNRGNAIFNSTTYVLPIDIYGLAVGNYTLRYVLLNSSYVFIKWEYSSNIIIWNSSSISTMATVLGDGKVTAVYYIKSSVNPTSLVTMQSSEETSASQNVGKIRLGDNLFGLSNSTSTLTGTYLLEYSHAQGYVFLDWAVSGNISILDSHSPSTRITINGNGSITAFYLGLDVALKSRQWENLSINFGEIKFNGTDYGLPRSMNGLPSGDYTIQFVLVNSTHVFLWWESSGDIILWNSTNISTRLRIVGDGTLTAVYLFKPSPPVNVTITLQSRLQDNSTPSNMGQMRFGDTFYSLPRIVTTFRGMYPLEYLPVSGFVFANWTTTGNVTVEDPFSQVTSVTATGNGTITAIYRGYQLLLQSRDWNNTSQNLGNITLSTTNYILPKTLAGLPGSIYPLTYTALNSSYVFLWWESSVGVVVWDGTSANTTLTLLADGNVTAVYGLASQPPPPYVGDWSVLYVDTKYKLMPGFMWSGKNGHLPSRASTGNDKQEAEMVSPSTPTLYLAQLVNVTAYIRPVPQGSAKDVYLELGFNYSGQYYKLGHGTFAANSQGMYQLTIDITYGNFTQQYGVGVIPEGSIIILKSVVTFYIPPNGFFFVYYGPSDPSRIELF